MRWLFRRDRDGIQVIYANAFFRAVGLGLFGIFIPIYIFQIFGGVEDWVVGLRWLVIFVLLERGIVALFSIEVGKMIERLGFRKSVLMATLLQIGVLGLLVGLENKREILWVISILSAFVTMFYWIARQGLFAHDGRSEEFGKEISTLLIIERGTAILGPFSGGVIVTLWGFEVLFLLGIGVMALSAVPLFFMVHHEHRNGISYQAFWEFVFKKEHFKYLLGFVGRAMDDAITVFIWPIFMFVIIGNYEQLGAIVSVVSVVSIAAIFGSGRVFDLLRSKKGLEDEAAFWLSATIVAGIRGVTGLVRTVRGIFLIDLISAGVRPFYWLPFEGYQLLAAKNSSPVAFFVFREVVYSVGVIAGMGSIYLLAGISYAWLPIFMVGGVGVVMSMMMARK